MSRRMPAQRTNGKLDLIKRHSPSTRDIFEIMATILHDLLCYPSHRLIGPHVLFPARDIVSRSVPTSLAVRLCAATTGTVLSLGSKSVAPLMTSAKVLRRQTNYELQPLAAFCLFLYGGDVIQLARKNKVPTRRHRPSTRAALETRAIFPTSLPLRDPAKIPKCFTNPMFPQIRVHSAKTIFCYLFFSTKIEMYISSVQCAWCGVAPAARRRTSARRERWTGKNVSPPQVYATIIKSYSNHDTTRHSIIFQHQETTSSVLKSQISARALERRPYSDMDSKEPTLSRRDTHGPFARYAVLWAVRQSSLCCFELSDVGFIRASFEKCILSVLQTSFHHSPLI